MDGFYWVYIAIGTINVCAGACILHAEITAPPVATNVEIEMSLLNLDERRALLYPELEA